MEKHKRRKQEKVKRGGYYLYKLMQGMLYPAMLGTFIVFYVRKFVLYGRWDLAFLFRIDLLFSSVLIFYFCLSYIVTESITEKGYNYKFFIVDVLEAITISLCLYFLGLEDHIKYEMDLFGFYITIAGILIISLVWCYLYKEKDTFYYWISAIMSALFLICAFTGAYRIALINYLFFVANSAGIYVHIAKLLEDPSVIDDKQVGGHGGD